MFVGRQGLPQEGSCICVSQVSESPNGKPSGIRILGFASCLLQRCPGFWIGGGDSSKNGFLQNQVAFSRKAEEQARKIVLCQDRTGTEDRS